MIKNISIILLMFSLIGCELKTRSKKCTELKKSLSIEGGFIKHENIDKRARLIMQLEINDNDSLLKKELIDCRSVLFLNRKDTVLFTKFHYYNNEVYHRMVLESPTIYSLDSSNYNELFNEPVRLVFNTIKDTFSLSKINKMF